MKLAKINNIEYYVASVKYCSYIQLVYSSKANANCKIVLVIIKDMMKLLLTQVNLFKKVNNYCMIMGKIIK